MKVPDSFTPLRIGLGVLLIVAAVVCFTLWNPWSGYLRSRVAKAEATTETTQDGLQGQIETVQGQQDVEAAASEVRVIIQDVREATHVLEVEARRAPDAGEPLDVDRRDRLRALDERLCASGTVQCRVGAGSGPAGPDNPG